MTRAHSTKIAGWLQTGNGLSWYNLRKTRESEGVSKNTTRGRRLAIKFEGINNDSLAARFQVI
jgi:hypothetical protein